MPHAPQPELHIASLVVHVPPSRTASVAESIGTMADVQVHAISPQGKLVVTLETGSAEEMTDKVSAIQHLDGVLSATLVYQCADTLEAMNEEMPHA
jgi:nitrate reductase NapD